MKENLVLCAIAKCENKYIKEWVQWHFNIGFDKIVVYDNNDVDGEKISDVIGDVPCVEIVDWRGKTQKSCETQVAAYNDCYKRHMNSKWIMFLDIDEFLEFKEGMDLRSFLEQDWVKRANDIKFHWKCYSDSGYINAPDGLVTENFTKECRNKAAVNCYVKHIYKCGLPKLNIVNVHYSSSLTNVFYQNGKTAPYLTITVDKNINHDVGWIRHYVTKSMEEFVFTKYARRGPGTSKNRLNVDFYFKYNERTPEKERKLREMIAELEPSKEEPKPIAKQEKPKKEPKTSWVIEPYYANKSYPGKSKEQTRELELLHKNENEQDNYPGGISICISAWNVDKYIEECLDSIVSQHWIQKHDNYEILIGVDHCEKTLEKLMSISDKYKDYNLKVFMMDKNVGTYIVSNTLMQQAKYRWLLRFDSDDVMLPTMIDRILKYATTEKFDVLQPYAINFGSRTNPIFMNHGCVLIKKVVFEKFGGYRPWKCAADTELIIRLRKYAVCKKYERIVFKRRVHSENLTCRKDTGMKSDLRQQYKKQTVVPATIKQAIIKCVTASFTKIKIREEVIDDFQEEIIDEKSIEIENPVLEQENVQESEPEAFVVDKIDYDGFLKCKNKVHVLIVDFKQLKFTQHIISCLLVQDTAFDLTIFEQKPDAEAMRYFKKLKEEWDSSSCELNVIYNSVNAPLNHVWNWFHEHTDNPYLAFLNNDIEICNNFISDAEQIFEKEEKCGIIIHPTNRPEYTKSYTLTYEKVDGYPTLQGWDFILNRNAYSPIPDNLWIWRGDVYLMTNAYNDGWEEYYDVSSPILHYTSSTVDTFKNEIQAILNKDKQYWKELDMKECTNREDNIYTHRVFNGIFPIDLTKKVIVSFTTWTKRISNVPGVVEMMMNQTKQPDLIILNLSYEEFKWHKRLLREVRALEKSNPIFKVNMVRGKNTTVWKKWLPIIDEYNNDLIIPIDDDIVYPDDFIKRLYNKWLENPYNPITGAQVKLGGYLQHHCGAGCLIFRQAFGVYMNDYKKLMEELCTSDVLYSFAAYMNGYTYVEEGMNVLKFGRHDETEPYSQAKRKKVDKQPHLWDFDFLSNYYLDINQN